MIRHCRFALTIATIAWLSSAGCATPKLPTWDDLWVTRYEDRVKESKYQQPTRMVVLWSPAIQNGPNVEKAQRGFGGRIYFYNKADQAVPVEGQLIVYGYNDTSPQQRHVKPDKKFTFTPQQFTAHYSPTELGASYSVWVGWDDVGGPQAEVSLVPIFTSASGHIVVGQTSRNVLPGPNTPASNTQVQTSTLTSQVHDERVQPPAFTQPTSYVPVSPTTHGMVEQASYQQPMQGMPGMYPNGHPVMQTSAQMPAPMPGIAAYPMAAEPQRPVMETMSITLPSSMAARLSSAATQQQPATAAQMPMNGAQPNYGNTPMPAMNQPMMGQPQPAYGTQPGVQQMPAGAQPQHGATFNAPTNSSRSWGPVTPRRGALPLGPQSRYEPASPLAPTSPGPQPFAGPPPTQPPHGAPGPVHPQSLQSATPLAGQGVGSVGPGIRL